MEREVPGGMGELFPRGLGGGMSRRQGWEEEGGRGSGSLCFGYERRLGGVGGGAGPVEGGGGGGEGRGGRGGGIMAWTPPWVLSRSRDEAGVVGGDRRGRGG